MTDGCHLSILVKWFKSHKSIHRFQAQSLGIGELPARICELKKLGFVFDKDWYYYTDSHTKKEERCRNYFIKEVPDEYK